MKKKLIISAIIFLLISVFSFYYAFKPSEIVIDFSDPAYSYLPESAKILIENEAKKGNRVLTEKNKEPNKVYLNPRYVEYLNLPKEERDNFEVIPQTYTYDYAIIKNAASSYPSSYRLTDLTIKDQSTLGICWAFATISSVETNILKTGLSSNKVTFAERQLDYAMANALTEVNNPYSMAEITNNVESYYELKPHDLGKGSNFVEAYMYLDMGISPVKEEIWGEYDTSSKKRPINEVLNFDNVEYQVSSFASYGDNIYNNSSYSATFKEDFMNKLKNHITNYGSLYIVTISPDRDAGICYNQTKNLINYDENNDICNGGEYHAMSLVGWDDNYEGGSWILKNSWGSSLPYVYMSYNSDFFDINGVIKVDAKNWDNGYNFTKSHTASYTSNAFEITYYKSAEFKENLEKINFVSWGINSSYKVYYKNGNESYKSLGTYTNNAPGLITIDTNGILLDKSSFSIKVTTSDGFIDGGINAFTSNVSNEKYLETYEFTNATNLKKQLITRNIESGTKLNYYVYDKYGKKYNENGITYVINGSVDINESLNISNGNYYLTLDDDFFKINVVDKIELKVGNTYQLEYEVSPNLDIVSFSYVISDPTIVSISDSGLVTSLKQGKTKITLNINDNIEIPIEVTSYKDSTIEYLDILDSDQTLYSSLVNEYYIHLDMKPSTYTYEDLIWSSSSDIATVENGLVRFNGSGNVKITVSSGALSDEINFNIVNSTSNISLSASKTTIAVGEELRLEHSGAIFGYRYSTSDNQVIRVRNGVVTGLKNGSAWVYYKNNNNDVAGLLINVIDEESKMNLVVDPSGGIYNNPLEISGNSLSTVNLDNPTYNVTVTLINGETTQNIDISHEFLKFNLLGYGSLDNNKYTFGFGDGKVTALWNYQEYTLPVLTQDNLYFKGWYKDPEFKEFFGNNITFTPKENITLYAKFEEARVGDINNDKEIDITDLVILGRYLVGLEEIDDNLLGLADINKDSEIDITDLVILGRYLVGLEEIN